MRKASTVEEEAEWVRARYKDGRGKGQRGKTRPINEESLDGDTLRFKRDYGCFLKAADYSDRYIADTLNLKLGTVQGWWSTEYVDAEYIATTIALIRNDLMSGAVKLLKSFALEGVEILMDIARRSGDDKVVIQAVTEVLDRAGLSKVSKTEARAIQTHEHTAAPDFFENLKGLPVETMNQLAVMADEMEKLVAEARHKG